MKPLKIKNVTLGEGIPKICVPLTGRTQDEIFSQAQEAMRENPDLLEWRADFFEELDEEDSVCRVCAGLGDRIGQVPLIFTVRSKAEGGNRQISTEDYVNLLKRTAKCREIDLVDVELYMDAAAMEELIGALHKEEKKVIVSNHHFEGTPEREMLEEILERMEKSSGDIRKLAVMPRREEEVLDLLGATLSAVRTGEKPVVTMSMGRLGAASRIVGEVFGSCMTFGTVGQASAPGQIPVVELRNMLGVLSPGT